MRLSQNARLGGEGARMEAAYRDMVMSQTYPVVLMLNVGGGYYVETDTTSPSPGLPYLIWGRLQIWGDQDPM